jgi:hypothetical protein
LFESITKITQKQRFSFQFFWYEKFGKLFQILEKLFELTIEQKTKTPKNCQFFREKKQINFYPTKITAQNVFKDYICI